jgi:hypothetical protein
MLTPPEVETELSRFRLPVSGRLVVLRHPRGAEDLLLLEAARTPEGDATLALSLVGRLAAAVDGPVLDWRCLSFTDVDVVVLRLRQAMVGDRVRADVACPAPACGRRIDIDFGIEQYLAHHAPEAPGNRGVPEPADEPGWFYLTGSPGQERIRFRLPTAADQLAVIGSADAADEVARRCIRPTDIPDRLRQQVEATLEAMAPSLSSDLQGVCPECGAEVSMYFDARWFCLRELRNRAAFFYQDVDVLARRYHWTESEILAMPHVRRAAYVDLARQVEGA